MGTIKTRSRKSLVAAAVVLVAAQAACSGTIAGDDAEDVPPDGVTAGPGTTARPGLPGGASPGVPGVAPGSMPTAPGGPPVDPMAAGARPILRLTRFELNNTLRDLLGDTSNAASGLLADDMGAHGFEVAAGVSAAEATILQEMAERVAADAVKARLAALVPCPPATGDEACARRFITTFGKRAWRRPLAADEQMALETLYTNVRKTPAYDFGQGIRVLIVAILQAPDFLYHLERLGSPVVRAGAVVQLSAWDLASRLSYFLVGTMPDNDLFAAAESGVLLTPQGLGAQVTRLFALPAARAGMGELTRQWLGLSRIDKLAKDPAIKEWTPAVRAALAQETRRFVESVVFDGDAKVDTLLSAPYSFLSDALGPLYGVTVAGKDFQKVPLDAAQRVGLLGQGSFLASQAGPAETSPVKRGHFVLSQFLCKHLPPPPENVPPLPAASAQVATTRQRTEQHAKDPACSACHSVVDPLGLAFEHYDAVGKYRTMEGSGRIDASGSVTLDGQPRAFTSGVQLSTALAKAAEVRACVGRQVLRYALGRAETDEDRGAVARAQDALARGNLRDLVATIPLTRSFTHRLASAGEVLP